MNKNLTTTNQNSKLALSKAKSLLDITNKLLANKENRQLLQSFKFVPFIIDKGHSDRITSIAISPDGKTIVSGSLDRTLKIWDMQSGECLNTLEGHSNRIASIAISPNGKTIVSGSEDSTIKIWDMQSGECIYTIDNSAMVSIDKDGYFVGEMEAIKKLTRVSEAPLSQRKLTDEEIKHFRKKGNFLEIGN